MEFNWLEGFSIATKVYFKLGHLDIKENVVTKKGFPIGKWLQWCRDNIEKLSLFEINDLCNYGMIWNNNSLGNHKDFNANLERLKEYRRDGIVNLDIIKEDDLKEWAMSLFRLRKLCDDTYLTLREVEMLADMGFDWGSKWSPRGVELSQRKEKVSYLLDKIHKYKSNKTLPADESDKKKENVVEGSGFDEYSVLSKAYITQSADKDAIKFYSSKIMQLGRLSVREVRLLKTLNDGRAGISRVFVPCVDNEYIMTLHTALEELEVYQEVIHKMDGNCWGKSDISLNGYSIIFLVCRVLLEIDVDIKLENVYEFKISLRKNKRLMDDIIIPYTNINYKKRDVKEFTQKIFGIRKQNMVLLLDIKKFVDKFRRTRMADIHSAYSIREMREQEKIQEKRREARKKLKEQEALGAEVKRVESVGG